MRTHIGEHTLCFVHALSISDIKVPNGRMMGDLLMIMCEEILDIKATTEPAMICFDSVYSAPAIDLKNSKVSCEGRAFLLLNAALPIEGYIKDEVSLKRRAADSGSMFSLGERGNEYQIQDVTHY